MAAETAEHHDKPRAGRSSRGGRLIKLAIALLVLIVIVVALLPTILSFVFGRGIVENLVADKVNGSVAIRDVSLSWFGSQRINGMVIRSPDDDATVEADIVIDRDLYPLLFIGGDYGYIEITGRATGVRYEDGGTSLQKLLRSDEKEPKERDRDREREPGREREEVALKAQIRIHALNVEIEDRALNQTVSLDDLTGDVAIDLAETSTVALAGATTLGESTGSISIDAMFSDLVRPAGLNLSRGSIDATVQLERVPVVLVDALAGMSNRLSGTIGPTIETAAFQVGGNLRNATGSIELTSSRASARGAFAIADGALTVGPDDPIILRAAVTDDTLAAWLHDALVAELGMTARPRLVSPTAPPQVEARLAAARIPLPGDDGLDLGGGAIDLIVTAEPMTIAFSGVEGVERFAVESFDAGLTSRDLTRTISLTSDLTGRINDREASSLQAAVDADRLIAPDGSVRFDVAALTGHVTAERIPTALAQGFASGTPLVLTRDVGPTVDLDAQFSAGDEKTITARVAAANLNAEVRAAVSADGAIRGERLFITTQPQPQLVQAIYTGGVTMPGRLSVELASFALPAPDPQTGRDLRASSGSGTVRLEGEPVQIPPAATDDQAAPPHHIINLARLGLSFRSDAIGDGVQMDGSLTADGADVTIHQRITNLFDDAGTLAPLGAIATGTIQAAPITASNVAAFAPDFAGPAEALLQGPLALTLATQGEGSTQRAKLTLQSKGVNGSISAMKNAEAIELESGSINLALTPEVIAALQPDAESPPAISAEQVTIELTPARLLEMTRDGYALADAAIEARVTSDAAQVSNIAGLIKPLVFRRLNATASASLAQLPQCRVQGGSRLRNGESNAPIAELSFDVRLVRDTADQSGKAALLPVAQLTLADVQTTNIDPLFGRDEPVISQWIGESGTLAITSEQTPQGLHAALDSEFPYLQGTFDLLMDEERIELAPPKEKVTYIATSEALQSFLNPPRPADGDAAAAAPPRAYIQVQQDVPLVLALTRCVIPRAILSGEPIENDLTQIDLTLTAENPPILRRIVEGERETVDAIFRRFSLTLKADTLDTVSCAIAGVLRTAEDEQSDRSRIEIDAAVHELLDEQKRLTFADASLDADATVSEFPTWVLDAFAGSNSLLSDALGQSVSAEMKSRGFSQDSGRLNATLTSANGSTADARLSGRGGGFRTRRDDPTTGALTFSKPLRDRILYRIHPIFSDIRAAEEQIRFTIDNVHVPADGDLSGFDADVRIEVGDITLDTGSELLRIMRFTEARQRNEVPGHIGDLNIRIRDGIVTYDNFVVSIDRDPRGEGYRHRLVFSGRINLATNHVDYVTAAYPLKDLAKSVEELQGIPGLTTVGIRFSGDLYDRQGNPKDLKMDLDLGLRGPGGEKPDDPLNTIGNILDDVLRRQQKGGEGDTRRRDRRDRGGGT